MPHPFIVMTGLSGAGKSVAIKVLEDLGYYTLDNLPPALIPDALRVCREAGYAKNAFVIDVRSGGVQPSIDEERRLLVALRARADRVIDTTHLSVTELRSTLHSLYGEGP